MVLWYHGRAGYRSLRGEEGKEEGHGAQQGAENFCAEEEGALSTLGLQRKTQRKRERECEHRGKREDGRKVGRGEK